jgi:hypothetical protein
MSVCTRNPRHHTSEACRVCQPIYPEHPTGQQPRSPRYNATACTIPNGTVHTVHDHAESCSSLLVSYSGCSLYPCSTRCLAGTSRCRAEDGGPAAVISMTLPRNSVKLYRVMPFRSPSPIPASCSNGVGTGRLLFKLKKLIVAERAPYRSAIYSHLCAERPMTRRNH